jgi:aspartyl-tRNA(Asn)/glutamyl-tRNA(Gln) amidotransferase subunit A
MFNLTFATIKQLRKALDDRTISPTELLDFYRARALQYDQKINSLLEIFSTDSIMQTAKLEGPLAGIPGAIKNNICIKDRITTCGSKMLQNYSAPYDATVIERLKGAGAFFLGTANMDEFAMGSSTETSAFMKTKNPWDLTRVPGGSSGGSAAAVAAGIVPWALGSETGGSVRQPAAFCGIVGLKPTYGLVSRYGLVAYGSSVDQVGIFARTVHDTASILSIIAGNDIKDSTTLAVPHKDYTQQLGDGIPTGLKIGIVDNALSAEGMDPEIASAVDQAVKVYESLGATITHVSLPTLDYSAAAYFIVSRAEAASNLARFDGVRYGMRDKEATSLQSMYLSTRHDGFGPEVRKRIMVGNYVLSAGHAGHFYENAKRVIASIRHEFLEIFKEVDLLIMPTHAGPAFTFGAYEENKLQMDLQDYFTCPVNLAGLPAVSLPCGFTKNKLPIGFQLIGPDLCEALLLQVANAYEQKTAWHLAHPDGF